MVTGEPIPIEKTAGAKVVGGTNPKRGGEEIDGIEEKSASEAVSTTFRKLEES